MKELLLGAGNSRKKKVYIPGKDKEFDFQSLVTIDIDPYCNPTILHDLNVLPYPLEDEIFDEIHAYDVLEHTGQQGDWKFFFDQFSELHRVLKYGGMVFIAVPNGENPAVAFSDPGHTRIFTTVTFGFLWQRTYEEQVGKTPISDYRHYWQKNFAILGLEKDKNYIYTILQKI